jgi:organic radical activating enzyme
VAAPDDPGAFDLVEVFSSVQGEGTHVGESTLFVRLGGCDLRCAWCDSPQTWRPGPVARFELERFSGRFRERDNPVAIDEVVEAAEALDLAAHRFVSLTGGEPLLQPEAVEALAARLGGRGPRIHLETHGLATEALSRVVDRIDVVSMDWKLASDVRREGRSTRDPEEAFHAEHAAFLEVALRAPEVVVKVVLTRASRDEELEEMAACLERATASPALVVQPVTPFASVREAPPAERLLQVVARLSTRLPDVRLIPQTHKQIGAL